MTINNSLFTKTSFHHRVSHIGMWLLIGLLFTPLPGNGESINLDSREDIEAAIAKFSQLIKTENNNATLYVKRGDAYFLLHDFDLAIKDYTAAIKQDDSLDAAYFGRGLAYGRRRLIDEGIADLDVFIKRNPESSLGYTKRGVRYLWKRDLVNASKDLTKAITLDSYNAEAHDDLGVVYSLQDKYSEAISHFLETVAIDPSYQKGYHNLAMSFYAVEKDQWALNAVNESLKLKPEARDSMKLKGLILKALGRNEEAQELLEDAEFMPEGNWSERVAITSKGADLGLKLMGIDTKQHQLGKYFNKDKWVILNIWGPKCPPCVEEMPQLQAFHDEHAEKDATVVGMAIDYPSFGFAKIDEVNTFLKLNSITYPMLLGDADIVPRFGAGPLMAVPMTIIYAPDGKMLGSQVGSMTADLLEEFIQGAQAKKASN